MSIDLSIYYHYYRHGHRFKGRVSINSSVNHLIGGIRHKLLPSFNETAE